MPNMRRSQQMNVCWWVCVIIGSEVTQPNYKDKPKQKNFNKQNQQDYLML